MNKIVTQQMVIMIRFVHITFSLMVALSVQPLIAMDEQQSSSDLWSLVKRHPVATLAVTGVVLMGGFFWCKHHIKKTNATPKNPPLSPIPDEARKHVSASNIAQPPVEDIHTKDDTAPEQKQLPQVFLDLTHKYGFAPVHKACLEGDTPRVCALLAEDNKNVDLVGPDCITPIMIAAGCGHIDATQVLLKKGGLKYPNRVDKKHMTALAYAVLHGHEHITCLLVEYIKSNHGSHCITDQFFKRPTPLHCALYSRQYAIARYLIEQGANFASRDLSGETPLHVAVRENVSPEYMVYLVSKCQDINILNRREQTALDYAFYYGHTQLVVILCNVGAKTADQLRQILEQEKKEEAWIRWLEQEYGSIDAINFEGLTLLDRARRAQLVQSEAILLKYGAKTAHELKENKT